MSIRTAVWIICINRKTSRQERIACQFVLRCPGALHNFRDGEPRWLRSSHSEGIAGNPHQRELNRPCAAPTDRWHPRSQRDVLNVTGTGGLGRRGCRKRQVTCIGLVVPTRKQSNPAITRLVLGSVQLAYGQTGCEGTRVTRIIVDAGSVNSGLFTRDVT